MRKKCGTADRPKMTKRRMRIASWVRKATDTRSEYVIFMVFPQQRWLQERASMLLYTYIACLLYYPIHVVNVL